MRDLRLSGTVVIRPLCVIRCYFPTTVFIVQNRRCSFKLKPNLVVIFSHFLLSILLPLELLQIVFTKEI